MPLANSIIPFAFLVAVAVVFPLYRTQSLYFTSVTVSMLSKMRFEKNV